MVQWFILNSSVMMKLLLMRDYTEAYCVHFTKFLRTTPSPPSIIWMHGIWTIMNTEFRNRHPPDNQSEQRSSRSQIEHISSSIGELLMLTYTYCRKGKELQIQGMTWMSPARFDVLTPVMTMFQVLWDMKQCRLAKTYWRFGVAISETSENLCQWRSR